MFPELITPATIGTTTFRIPLYQRPYAWEVPQVSQLLTDLYDAFEEGRKSETPNDYHIGILSVAKTPDDCARYDLIDGQQRITTLMLIGIAVKSYFCNWQQFLESDGLDLYGRENDKKFLKGESGTDCNRRMVDAVGCARDFFLDLKDHHAEFSEYIYNHAAFFLSEVPSTYSLLDKNQQFVRMNNRGKQLEKHEILKVKLLAKIEDPGERSNAFSIWNTMVACLTGIDGSQQGDPMSLRDILASNLAASEPAGNEVRYTSMLTVPEFLLLALYRFLQREEKPSEERTVGFFKTDKLLETFFVLEGEGRITDFTKTLQKQVEVFRSFFIFLSKEEKYEFGGKSNTEDRDFDFETNPNGKNRLIASQSFLYVSTAPHHWMIDAFDWCQLQSQPIKSEEFIKELERIDDSLNNSANGNWKRNSPIKDLKEMTYPSVSHYWFYRLDYELWKRFFTAHSNGKNPDDIWSNLPKEKAIRGLVENFRFRRCGSVEHIVPQTTMNGLVRVEPDHTFGNLALISSSRNSTFSNNMPETKKAMILQSQQPYTESLKMLHFLWCDPASASHGDKMFEILNHAKK